jgi:hypothetical protein
MPEISRFHGIVIAMYYNDHPPSHFHARAAGVVANISIETGELIVGELPNASLDLVSRWAAEHKD